MKVIVKKTYEVSDEEIISMYKLYEGVFHQKHDVNHFREMFNNSSLGYSYHSFLLNDTNDIVGFHSCVPFYYLKGEDKFLAALGINSMVHPDYRDFFNFREMFLACQEYTKKDGCKLRIGFPNDNSYPILIKGFKHKKVGDLHTYVLPIKVGGIKKKLKTLNIASQLYSFLQINISRLNKSTFTYTAKYRKERESFDSVRYQWFGGNYRIIEKNNFKFVYKVDKHEGIDVAFLLDVYPLNGKNFDSAVRHVYSLEKKKIDMIMYVGNLQFKSWSLLKVPLKYAPKNFRFTVFPLDKKYFDSTILDINNWELNLSNYDLL